MEPAGPTQRLHRVTIGRTREVRGPDAFERGVAGIIIAVVSALALGFGLQLSRMVQTLEAVSMTSTAKIDSVTYHTIHGHWPRAGDPDIVVPGTHSAYVQRLALDDHGSITATATLGPLRGIFSPRDGEPAASILHGSLSFRPALLGARDAPTISYLCGYAKPVAGTLRVSGANRTTLPRQVLPPFCR